MLLHIAIAASAMRAKAGVTCGLLLAVLLALTTHADAQGFYTVIAPRVLRPNSEYHVSVSTHGVDRTTQVTVEVGGRQDSGGRFSASQSTAVEPRTTRMIKIEVGDVGPGSYNVTARGSGGLDFVNSTQLTYVHKSYSVFVQTDKAIYKPGDTVMLRVLPLSKYLRPTVTAPIDIYISDGKGNRVKQWTRELPQRGVFAKELLLSKNPVLGTWNVTVRVLDQEFSKTFLVAEYVLPKFEVIVTAPKYATFKDSRVAVTVHSKYTYGKPVTGEATITAYPTIFSGIIQPIFQPPIRKVVPINGKASVEFDIAKELMLNEDFERPIQIDVVVEEALTGRRQNATHSITLHKHQYKLELVKTSEYFKPGLKYTAFIKLSRHDGTPVSDSKNPVKVRWGYGYDHDSYTNESHILSADGTVQLTFYPPRESNFSTLGLEAEYLDLNEWFSTISASISPSNTFLQASMKTKDAQVGSDVEVVVNCTETINSFNYDVLGRGDVLLSRSVSVPPGSKDHRFRFSAVNAMAPTAHLIVYYVRPESGEVVADALDFSVSGMLNNFVDMDVRPGETQPGSNVDITLRTKPNSYVGLLGVDQSVLLLQSGNDISMDEVENELNSYDSVTDQNDNLLSLRDARLRNRRSLFWWPGSADAGEVFEKSGAVVLTNGYVHEHTPLIYYRNLMDDEMVALRAESGINGPFDQVDGSAQTPRLRQHFPETWLWELLDAGATAHIPSGYVDAAPWPMDHTETRSRACRGSATCNKTTSCRTLRLFAHPQTLVHERTCAPNASPSPRVAFREPLHGSGWSFVSEEEGA
ncbi:hypothetical protein B566_EDAN005973 [Ephemera danica]|nr:hypothetical protein B566_EDAN005973 [Ephemera danica]